MECLVFTKLKQAGISAKRIEKIVFFVLKKIKKNGSLSVHLIGDTQMKKLNKIYRGKNQTTDVLSFSAREGNDFKKYGDELGDIFIAIPQIKRQAKENKILQKQELIRMIIHGVLHLVGYDHMIKKQADKMFSLQEKLVKDLL